MTIKSQAWGVGWYKETGLPSIPGRTARLKAIYLLQIAAEVEHALMAQYLYAAYSLDETFQYADPSENTAIIDQWRIDLRDIARQEMAHFITVQNLLISLGAEVYVNRENNFSEHPDAYPFPVRFEKFSLESVARYVATESPDPKEIDGGLRRRLNRALRVADRNSKEKINRVGVLYAILYWLFLESDQAARPWKMSSDLKRHIKEAHLGGVHLEDRDFARSSAYREFAANGEEFGVYESGMQVDSSEPRESALQAIKWIMIQGEGLAGTGCTTTDSHFCRFLNIFENLNNNQALAQAALNVPLNPVVLDPQRKEPVSPESDSITHPESMLWAKLFNVRYQMVLLELLLGLSSSRKREPDLRRELLSGATRKEMEFLKRIGQLLPTLPRHQGSRTQVAGAPFETVPFPADNTKRWDQLRVLIDGSAEIVRKLASGLTVHDQRFSLLDAIREFDQGRSGAVRERATAKSNYAWREGNRRIARTPHD